MKAFNIGWVFITAILFTACSGGIVGNPYPNNQGHFLPLNDSLLSLEKSGDVQIDRTVDGNPLIQNMWVKFEPNFWQKKRLAQHNHTIWVFYIFSILALLFAVIGIWYGNDPGRIRALPIIAGVLVVICGIIAVASIDTSHEKEFQLPKIQYDSLKNAGAIDHYIDQHLYE